MISGDWVKFLPSELNEVGPNGTVVDMLIAGAVRPFVNNDISNVSMIIQAVASTGVQGEVALPLEGYGGFVVINSTTQSDQQFQSPSWDVFAANQTNYGVESIIYDPSAGGANQTLPISVSILGFLDASGVVVQQPSWLQFSLPQSSEGLVISPYDPLYIPVAYQSTSAAPLGSYTVVISIEIGGSAVTIYTPVVVSPPIFA